MYFVNVRKRMTHLAVVLIAVGCVLIPFSEEVAADLVMDKDESANAPREVFGLIGAAWEDGDEEALANLIHHDGLKVTSKRTAHRENQYSPSQAYYYFRNIFQSHRTLLFEFEMMQDAEAGGRVHGMAVWKRRRPDSEIVQELKLVCILVQDEGQWKLAEINTIR